MLGKKLYIDKGMQLLIKQNYFIKTSDLANYADDNSISIIANTIEVVLAALKQDTENAIK